MTQKRGNRLAERNRRAVQPRQGARRRLPTIEGQPAAGTARAAALADGSLRLPGSGNTFSPSFFLSESKEFSAYKQIQALQINTMLQTNASLANKYSIANKYVHCEEIQALRTNARIGNKYKYACIGCVLSRCRANEQSVTAGSRGAAKNPALGLFWGVGWVFFKPCLAFWAGM